MKAFWKKGLVLLVSAGMTLGILELALRAGAFQKQYSWSVEHGGDLERPKGKWMILGDSFSADWKTGQSLAELLYPEFRKRNIEILNTAGFGYGPQDYLIQMKAYAPGFHPDRVLLFYYAGNDLTDVQYRRGWAQELKIILKPWLVRFRLLHFLKTKWEALRLKEAYSSAGMSMGREMLRLSKAGKVNLWLVLLGRKKPEYLRDNLLMETKQNRDAWLKVKNNLKRIKDLSGRRGADLMIVIIPPTSQVNSSHFDFYETLGFKTDERTLTSSEPQQRMKEFCEEEKIQCLDLLPAFRAQSGKEFYLDWDDHFNFAGNRLAKELILNFLFLHESRPAWVPQGSR